MFRNTTKHNRTIEPTNVICFVFWSRDLGGRDVPDYTCPKFMVEEIFLSPLYDYFWTNTPEDPDDLKNRTWFFGGAYGLLFFNVCCVSCPVFDHINFRLTHLT